MLRFQVMNISSQEDVAAHFCLHRSTLFDIVHSNVIYLAPLRFILPLFRSSNAENNKQPGYRSSSVNKYNFLHIPPLADFHE